jgi:sugar/nucleoside kinase (ribokinase family)
VIVVIGSPIASFSSARVAAAGTPARIALAAARAGRTVQLVGKIGDDPTGEAVLLDLARGGVRHAALIRDAAHPTPIAAPEDDATLDLAIPVDRIADGPAAEADTSAASASLSAGLALEPADIDLALHYLTGFDVLVLADPLDAEAAAVGVEAAAYAGARLVVVQAPGTTSGEFPPEAVVLQAPDADPDGVFAALVGSFAAALDGGAQPDAAFRASVAAAGWTAAVDA